MIVSLYRGGNFQSFGVTDCTVNDDGSLHYIRNNGSSFGETIYGYEKDGSFIPHRTCGPAITDLRIKGRTYYEFFYHGVCVKLGDNCDTGEERLMVELKYGDLKFFVDDRNGTPTYYI